MKYCDFNCITQRQRSRMEQIKKEISLKEEDGGRKRQKFGDGEIANTKNIEPKEEGERQDERKHREREEDGGGDKKR